MFGFINKIIPLKFVKTAVTILAVIGVIAIAIFAFRTFGGSRYQINTSGTAVIKELQSLNRYETSVFTIEKIIDAGTTGASFTQFLFGDKLLLIANGQVVAGFDFSKLTKRSVQINGSTITMDLPAPEILFVTLDESKTRVYDRSTGLLTKGDKDLESKAREAAQASIKQAACEGGILDDASRNGRSQLTAMLKALGFTTVVVNIPSASCK